MRGDHCAQPQEREALGTPNMKLRNHRVSGSLDDPVDANRSQLVTFRAKSVQHVSGRKVVMRRLELRCTTSHDLMVDPPIPDVQSIAAGSVGSQSRPVL